MIRIFLSSIPLLLLSACGVSQADYEKLAAENRSLKKEVDELRFGADRLVASVETAYAAKNYALAKLAIKQLAERHPESPQNIKFSRYLLTIESAEREDANRRAAEEESRLALSIEKAYSLKKYTDVRQAVKSFVGRYPDSPKIDKFSRYLGAIELAEREEIARKAAEEKERERLANLNNTGMWTIGHYVDEFGNKTNKRYITNRIPVAGSFSNSATEDSALGVEFLINSENEIAVKLYEYARENPVKTTYEKDYQIAVQDSDGSKYYFDGANYSDRIRLNLEQSGNSLSNALAKGGTVKFRITGDGSTYKFEVNPKGFDNALRLMAEPEQK